MTPDGMFSPKAPGEAITVSLNFRNVLEPGETITACTFAATVLSGTDPSPFTILSGPADITKAPVCLQAITGGLAGVTYLLAATVTTSKGHTLVGSASISVIPGGAR